MNTKQTQEERLECLVEAFKADSDDYKELQTPADTEGRRCVLRSLMNIRMPGKMKEDILKVVWNEWPKKQQDERHKNWQKKCEG